MSQYGISDSASYSRISTAELNSLVRQIVTENNALGEVSVRSRLGYTGLKFTVQEFGLPYKRLLAP